MRQPKPWFRTSKNAWYVQHGGQKIRLGEHPNGVPPPKKTKAGWNAPPAILDAFYKVMASDPANLPKSDRILTAQICDLFLAHSERHNERVTYLWYRSFLQRFCDLYARLPARDLRPIHVTRWLDAHAHWGGGRRNAVAAVKRAFNWADRQGVLTPNPLRNVEKPPARRRTRVHSSSERAELLAAIPDRHFREFVLALQLTGCRPSEVARVTAPSEMASGPLP